MIGGLIERVRPRVAAADAVVKTDESLSVFLPDRGAPRAVRSASAWCQLRVRYQDRIGYAGSVTPGAWGDGGGALVEAALTAAPAGEPGDLLLPAPGPVPAVVSHHPEAGAAGPAQVIELARLLVQRLERAGRKVDAWAERSAGTVQIANTRDLIVRYEATLVGVGALIHAGAEPGRPLEVHYAGVGWPGTAELDRLVADADLRLGAPLLDAAPAGVGRVWFAPAAVAVLLRPVAQALVAGVLYGGLSPLAGRIGDPVLPDSLTLVDDPLAPARPGSRPADDEGVSSRLLPLIEKGRLVGGIADLASGLRFSVPSTGHARRRPFAPPRPAFTNLILQPGEADQAALAGATGEGMLIADLPSPTGNSLDGRIALATPWAYRVADGVVAGRLPRVIVRGNVYRMLERLVAVGREALWSGSWCCPDLVLDDVETVPG